MRRGPGGWLRAQRASRGELGSTPQKSRGTREPARDEEWRAAGKGGGAGCGSLLELFIAAPSSWAPLPSARRSPGPPPPRPGIPGPHPLPAPDPAPGTWRGRGRCDSPSPTPYLPCPGVARQGEGRTGFSLGGAPGEGETQGGTPRSRPQEQARFLPAQPWRRCPLDCLRPSSSGSVHDEPSSLPSLAVDPHTCATCPPPLAPRAPAAPPRPAPLPGTLHPDHTHPPAHRLLPILSPAVTPSLSFGAALSTPAWSPSFPGQKRPSLASPSSPFLPRSSLLVLPPLPTSCCSSILAPAP